MQLSKSPKRSYTLIATSTNQKQNTTQKAVHVPEAPFTQNMMDATSLSTVWRSRANLSDKQTPELLQTLDLSYVMVDKCAMWTKCALLRQMYTMTVDDQTVPCTMYKIWFLQPENGIQLCSKLFNPP